jgi:hypothetical protein
MLVSYPCTLTFAKAYINKHHRHHIAPIGMLFAVSAFDTTQGKIVGVCVVGRPVARNSDDGFTCEVTRLAADGTRNACSFLYHKATNIAKLMGYARIQTYILESESGSSLKGLSEIGWRFDGKTQGGSWSHKGRPREDKHPLDPKQRWVCILSTLVLPKIELAEADSNQMKLF